MTFTWSITKPSSFQNNIVIAAAGDPATERREVFDFSGVFPFVSCNHRTDPA
jgi:hypothetical protein